LLANDAGERRDWQASKKVAAVQREASDDTAFRLALVENLHREDLSHQEQVEALDMLATMVDGQGLRYTASELGISPGWLSRRLSMRQDPVVFPALEEGHITFVQASELLSAPVSNRPEHNRPDSADAGTAILDGGWTAPVEPPILGIG